MKDRNAWSSEQVQVSTSKYDRKWRPRSWLTDADALTDNQDTVLLGYEGPADGRNHRRHCGRHSCRALFSSDGRTEQPAASRKNHDPREDHNQATLSYGLLSLSLFLSTLACQLRFSSHYSVQCFLSACRRPDVHRSATRNTTGDHFFAKCADRHAIIPTIYLQRG